MNHWRVIIPATETDADLLPPCGEKVFGRIRPFVLATADQSSLETQQACPICGETAGCDLAKHPGPYELYSPIAKGCGQFRDFELAERTLAFLQRGGVSGMTIYDAAGHRVTPKPAPAT